MHLATYSLKMGEAPKICTLMWQMGPTKCLESGESHVFAFVRPFSNLQYEFSNVPSSVLEMH